MARNTMEGLTTPEMLDALASGVDALADKVRALSAELQAARNGSGAVHEHVAAADVHCTFPVFETPALTPEALRVRMEYAGLSKARFSEVFGIPIDMVQAWLSGEGSIPVWVLPSIHIFELLTPTERKRFASAAAVRSARNPAKIHPFSRIEEL